MANDPIDPETFLLPPHTHLRLKDAPTSHTHPYKDKDDAAADLAAQIEQLATLQETLYASRQHAVLIILQGMDCSGKDGAVRHIFSGVNPAGCNVASFKVPTELELRHDYLWRCHREAPPRGVIGIFNRSWYEDVVIARAHGQLSDKNAAKRLREITDFERMLADNGTVIRKFYLHISRKEQAARLQSRLDTPKKHWKLDPSDFKDRKLWPEYTRAYEEALSATSRKHAPWHIVPADHKWFRNVTISRLLVETLQSLNLKYPEPKVDAKKLKL